jgi:XTP/dITP diphosphohydrolase
VELVAYSAVLGDLAAPPEEGATFADNAIRKAQAAARASMLVTLADDSGLEVDALAGRPGVRSARFAKEGATDAENNAALLGALDEIEDELRTARFRCVLALADPWGDLETPVITEGSCEGLIAQQTSGSGGFGYDPLFIVQDGGRTMAELSQDEKNQLSHRARAVDAMRPLLRELIARRMASAARVLRSERERS